MHRRDVYRVLVGKAKGKRSLGRHKHRLGDTVKMDHKEIGLKAVDYIHLAQDRVQWQVLVNTVMNLWVP